MRPAERERTSLPNRNSVAESSVNRETTSYEVKSATVITVRSSTCLYVNSITLSDTVFYLADGVFRMSVEYLEVSDFFFREEWPSH